LLETLQLGGFIDLLTRDRFGSSGPDGEVDDTSGLAPNSFNRLLNIISQRIDRDQSKKADCAANPAPFLAGKEPLSGRMISSTAC
jgi:hypothetical protein